MASGKYSGRSTLKGRANWGEQFHKLFVESCLQQTLNGNRPGTSFNKEGWRNILESFHRTSGIRYDRKQLKNHWDTTKKQWKAWCNLIGTSIMKWDSDTHKFGASEQDWAKYLEEHPEAAQFRHDELQFADKLEIIFDGIAVTGETEPPSKRTRHYDSSTTSLSNPKELEAITHEKRIERPLDAVESRSAITVQYEQGKKNYSIGECIECLDSMEEVEQGSDLYLFALDLFLKKEYREIFLQLKKSSVRFAWLNRRQSVGLPLL